MIDQLKKAWRGTHTFAEVKKEADEEAIDAFIYLCNYFAISGIDVVEAYSVKRAINAERFANWSGRVGAAGSDPTGE